MIERLCPAAAARVASAATTATTVTLAEAVTVRHHELHAVQTAIESDHGGTGASDERGGLAAGRRAQVGDPVAGRRVDEIGDPLRCQVLHVAVVAAP